MSRDAERPDTPPPELSAEEERDLVESARAGEREALERLLECHRARLASVAYFRLGAAPRAKLDVEEVVQEACARAIGCIDRFAWRGKGSFFQWLRAIAENVIREAAGRERRHPTSALSDARVESPAASPSRLLRREERFERLQAALQSLTPDHRQVILLARVQGVPLKEIGERMGRSPDAISKLLARALASLKELFGDTEFFSLPDRELDGS